MKFNNGYWERIEGIDFKTPTEIRSIDKVGDKMLVYSSTKPVPHRGETINATLITTEISSPMNDIIRVKHFHYDGCQETGPKVELKTDGNHEVEINIGKESASFKSGNTSVIVSHENGWTMKFYYKDRKLTGTTRKDMGYISNANHEVFMKEQLSLGVGECVYGLGERFTNFVKNGQVVELWNEDGGTSSEIAYKNIPFYVTSNGYGVYINHLEKVSVEVGSEVVTGVGFSVPGEYLEYYVIGGENLKKVIENFTALTERPVLPPAWSFGLWLTPSFSIDYDAQTIREFVDGMKKYDIPLRVFNLDSFYQKEYQFCDFEFDLNLFPDPQGLINELISKGLKLCIWINPYIAQKSPLFAEGKKNGYFIRYKNGNIYQVDKWMPGMAIVDFTNPEACKWYSGYLTKLLDMGINCFKTDFGEKIPVDNISYFDGSDPVKMHNYYSYLYNKVVFETVQEKYGKNNSMVFARSAATGSQKFPVHWAGDSYSSYESMAETLRGGLSLSLSGFGFWSHDISGFEKTATPDLYKRWTAFGLLSTHSRLHGSESFRVPWLFGEEAVDVLRFFTKMKNKLMPYIYSMSYKATKSGIPVMRPMLLEFEDDQTCKYLDLQYMFGDSLLVAPIFNDAGNANYYLPQGNWTNYISGQVSTGGRWIKEYHDYFSLPLMVRPNSIIPVGQNDQVPDYDYAQNVELHVYQLDDTAAAVVYNMDGGIDLSIEMKRSNDSINVGVKTVGKLYSIVLHNISSAYCDNAETRCQDNKTVIIPDSKMTNYTIKLSK